MRRTQQSSIEALEKAIEEQKNTRDFNYINDLKMLRKQYTCTSKRDYLKLLDLLVDKYSAEETVAVHAALMKKVQAGDLEAIRLWNEMSKENRDVGEGVQIDPFVCVSVLQSGNAPRVFSGGCGTGDIRLHRLVRW